ncbi:hypothetical protein EUX98_g5139 [Antrodiella citrinella]|uniref:Uncharacterized protein n=1 Tax=Antrodiella citrinella TaxID=2447956 RepID=A0A4S4MV06_9APHY|nr:hypothetical protein EUX98_g5139 [Antrodiella citrinella]
MGPPPQGNHQREPSMGPAGYSYPNREENGLPNRYPAGMGPAPYGNMHPQPGMEYTFPPNHGYGQSFGAAAGRCGTWSRSFAVDIANPAGPFFFPSDHGGRSISMPPDHLSFQQAFMPGGMQNTIELEHRINELETKLGGVASRLEEAEEELKRRREIDDEDGPPKKRTKASESGANTHPDVKIKVHEMTWAMLHVDKECYKTLAGQVDRHHDGDELETQMEDGEVVYYPQWKKPVNAPPNEAFISKLVSLVYNNEKSLREAGQGTISDAGFNQGIMRHVAQHYFTYISRKARKATTPEGLAQIRAETKRSSMRSRRTTKSTSRRKPLDANLIKEHNIPGATQYIQTDYQSSVYEYDSADPVYGCEEVTARRTEQGFLKGAYIGIPKSALSKKLIKFQFWCDWKSKNMAEAEAEAGSSRGGNDTGPSRNVFYGPYSKADPTLRLPKTAKAKAKKIIYKGMLRKSVVKRLGIEVQDDLSWWDGFDVPVHELPQKYQDWLHQEKHTSLITRDSHNPS